MNSTQTEQKTKKQSAPQTPKRRENSRRKEQRTRHGNTLTALYHKIPYHYVLGDFLYMVGFWVEYTLVRTWRRLREALQSIGAALGNLVLLAVRPLVLGVLTLLEDIASPFVHMVSGLRHIRQLPQQLDVEDASQIRKAKAAYFRRGVKKYLPVVWNAMTYFLPALAAAVLIVVVRNGLGL